VQDPGERAENLRRGVFVTAAFKPQVVVGADAGQQGDFFAAQPGNAAIGAPGNPGLLRADQPPPGTEVAAEQVGAVRVVHIQHRKSGPGNEGGP
jgi:hypothetical protein